jgi:hypothetical protein
MGLCTSRTDRHPYENYADYNENCASGAPGNRLNPARCNVLAQIVADQRKWP